MQEWATDKDESLFYRHRIELLEDSEGARWAFESSIRLSFYTQ